MRGFSSDHAGTWYHVLYMMSLVAIATNVALIVFSSTQLSTWLGVTGVVPYIIAAGLEHVFLLAKFVLSVFIPDAPKYVSRIPFCFAIIFSVVHSP